MNRIVPVLLLLVAACREAAPPPPPAAPAPAVPAAPAPTPAEALDGLDARKPVPLLAMMANHQKQNMREHLVAVQEIVSALAANDFAAVEKAAAKVGFSEQMGMMCNHMGAGAPGFSEQALQFHHTADGIGEAARKKDAAGVLKALDATLQTCTACHETWKQRVVSDAQWKAATGTAAPMPH